MTYEVCSVMCGGPGFNAHGEFQYRWYDNRSNKISPCEAYQKLLEKSKKDIILYAHDDLVVESHGWLARILSRFEDTDVAVVGLGGATGLGNADLYRKKYDIRNMARSGYMSNQVDWQVHGKQETTCKRVAVVDAFFMAVRRSFLNSVVGWPTEHLTHHCLDLWLACEVARKRMETWMVGVECHHLGGGSSIKPVYAEAKWLQGGTLESDHALPHRWIFENYRDVLPLFI
jgi:hypothetical protein